MTALKQNRKYNSILFEARHMHIAHIYNLRMCTYMKYMSIYSNLSIMCISIVIIAKYIYINVCVYSIYNIYVILCMFDI